jgi:tripartite ATP-independent transporter DctM subunit
MVEPNWIWGIVQVVLLCVASVVGMHIFLTVGALGVIFALLYYGNIAAIGLIGVTVWGRAFNYELSMIPLFILMGAWVERAGVGRDAYNAAMIWLSRLKGALAIVSTVANALFGAVTGSALAAVATIGGVGLPEMKRYGYAGTLRTGAIASGAMLSNLIPPSIAALIYCLLTDVSVGKVFIAGIIPGIILMALFCIIVYIWVSLRPNIAPMLPPDVRFTWGERFRSIALIIPIILIFLILIGGIYMGWFSPTEAGGMGAFAVMIVCLAYRRLNWNSLNDGLLRGARLAAMILILLVGAFIYTHTLALTALAMTISNMVASAGLTYIPVTYLIILIFILTGMFLDTMAMQILFIPLFFPVITTVTGAPPMAGVWFGTVCVVLIQLALVTPPIAGVIYLTQMIDGCPTSEVIKGVIPFYAATFGLLVLLIHFPFLSTWLPSMMIGG